MKIVVDHIAGSRRGQRQEFEPVERLRFGRHPENEVAFDAHGDLDASSRHAELRRSGDEYVLRDVGSSNGTYVNGDSATEATIRAGQSILVEFGEGGPRVRIFIGDEAAVAELPEIEEQTSAGRVGRTNRTALVVVVLALIGAVAAAIWWRFSG